MQLKKRCKEIGIEIKINDKTQITKEVLLKYRVKEKLTYTEITKKLNLGSHKVTYWCKKYGID